MDVKKEVEKIERRYGVSFGLDSVIAPGPILSWLIFGAGAYTYLPFLKNTVFVNSNLSPRQFLEALYHELGHAFVEKYKVKIPRFFNACSGTDIGYWGYLQRGMKLAHRPRRSTYCSGYSETNREEAFCETFSCYLLNRKTTGQMTYEGETFTVKEGTRLHKKFLAVAQKLEEVRANAY